MKLALLSIWFALPMLAQDISFNPLGKGSIKDYTGHNIKSWQVVDVNICSPGQTLTVSGGDIVRAASDHKLTIISNVAQVTQAANKAVTKSFWYLVLDAGGYVSLVLPELQASGLVKWGTKATYIMLAGHSLADAAKPKIQARVADPGPLLKRLLDPSSPYTIPFHGTGCLEGFLVAKYDKKVTYEAFNVSLGTTQQPQITIPRIFGLPNSSPNQPVCNLGNGITMPCITLTSWSDLGVSPPPPPSNTEGVQRVAGLTASEWGPGVLGY